jgi:hypothetical protein
MPVSSYQDSLSMWGSKPVIIAVSNVAARNAVALEPGLYVLTSDVPLFFLQGNDNTVTADNVSNYLAAGSSVDVEVRAGVGEFVSVLRDGSTNGRAFLMKPASEIA